MNSRRVIAILALDALARVLMPMRPGDCILQPVIAPEQLAADDEGRRSEDAEALRLVGLLHQQGFGVLGPGQREHPLWVLPDFLQAMREIWLASGLLAALKPVAIGGADEIDAPSFLHADQRHEIGGD